MSRTDYLYFEDPGEVEHYIEILVEYIRQSEWGLALEEVNIHIQAMKKQLRVMGGDYEYLADECNSTSDALHLSKFSTQHIEPFLDVLRACYAMKEHILPSNNKFDSELFAERLKGYEKAAILDLVWFVSIQERKRAAKSGAESVKARRKKAESRDQALVEKAREYLSLGFLPYQLVGQLAGAKEGCGLSKKQIRNILQNNGVLQKRTQKGK
jgi:hypothetical protein